MCSIVAAQFCKGLERCFIEAMSVEAVALITVTCGSCLQLSGSALSSISAHVGTRAKEIGIIAKILFSNHGKQFLDRYLGSSFRAQH